MQAEEFNHHTIARFFQPFSLVSGWAIRAGIVGTAITAVAGPGIGPVTDADAAGFDRAGRIASLLAQVRTAAVASDSHAGHSDAALHGACVSLSSLSILFEPEVSARDVEVALEQLPDEELAYFVPNGGVWTATATNGAVSTGQPLTITYSFVPDGTSIFSSVAQDSQPSNLFATMDGNFPGGRAAWKARVRAAFDRFSTFSNITYVEVSDDGAAWPSSPGALGSRGDVRICMRPIGDGPLAVNFFPQFGGDMMLDSLDIDLFANATNDFRAFRNVLMHEHGHGVGLNHVLPQNGTKLMEPALNTSFDGPQEDDVRGVQHLYGDAYEANDIGAQAAFVGGPLRPVAEAGVQTLNVAEAALERANASDFYSFTAFAAVPIAIRVEPVGSTYDSGPQFGNPPAPVNAAATRNLGLRLWRRVSAQTGQLSLLAQIDFNSAGVAEYHPPIPYTLAGFMIAEVYSTDGLNDVQRYALTISNSAIQAPVSPGNLRVFANGAEMGDTHTHVFAATTVGQTRSDTIQISNDGTGILELGMPTVEGPAAGDFSFTLLQDEVQPGAFVAMAIAFSPTAVGQRVAVVNLPNNDPERSNFSFIVSGSGLGTAQLEVQINGAAFGPGTTFDFGDVTVGEESSASVVLRNVGTAQLNISSISFLGVDAGDFAFGQTSAAIPAGGQVTRPLSFSPAASGPRNAQLRFISNSVPTGFSINLSGNGVAPITDCNGNGVDDATDLSVGTSQDCNADGIPDECQADADRDGVIDPCDQYPGQDDRLDTDGDGVVDAADGCPQDENKTQPGACGCGVAETDSDLDGNPDCLDAFPNDPNDGVPPLVDCNGNGVADAADIAGGVSTDCNGNGVPDVCEPDSDADGVIDACEPVADRDPVDPIDGEDDQDPTDPASADEQGTDARFVPSPCGVGIFPALMVTGLSLVSGRSTFRRRR